MHYSTSQYFLLQRSCECACIIRHRSTFCCKDPASVHELFDIAVVFCCKAPVSGIVDIVVLLVVKSGDSEIFDIAVLFVVTIL